MTRVSADHRAWVADAVRLFETERAGCAETPLVRLAFPGLPGIAVHIKDESLQPTGSLKHRLARTLFLHAICDGAIGQGTHVVEASSGCAAIAEAHFAGLLGLQFTAVVPKATAPGKIEAIRDAGGNVHIAPPGGDLAAIAADLADRPGFHFMDQFTNAVAATDWRRDNIGQEIVEQLAAQKFGAPSWMIVGAGTGCTATTIGRYVRSRPDLQTTRLCVVDPRGSILFKLFAHGPDCGPASNSDYIEGIGRKRPSPSFNDALVDRMIAVPDEAAIAATRWLAGRMGKKLGPSTGANLIGVLALVSEAHDRGEKCSIVTVGGDCGERYAKTIYCDDWVRSVGLDLGAWEQRLRSFDETGKFDTAGLEISCR